MTSATDTLIGLIRADMLPSRALFALFEDSSTSLVVRQYLAEKHPEFARTNKEWVRALRWAATSINGPQGTWSLFYREVKDHIRAEIGVNGQNVGLFNWRPFHWVQPNEAEARILLAGSGEIFPRLWEKWDEAVGGQILRDLNDNCISTDFWTAQVTPDWTAQVTPERGHQDKLSRCMDLAVAMAPGEGDSKLDKLTGILLGRSDQQLRSLEARLLYSGQTEESLMQFRLALENE